MFDYEAKVQSGILYFFCHVTSSSFIFKLPTYLSSVNSTGDVGVKLGRAVEVQLRLLGEVELQPSVLSGRGWVNAGEGGYSCAPRVTHIDATNPDNKPDKPPCGKTAHEEPSPEELSSQ